jgi:hypothetical protein
LTSGFTAGTLYSMSVYEIRKHLGHKHEEHITNELRTRGWRVAPYGMGTHRPLQQALISASNSPLRYEPDLLASPIIAPERAMLIECKAQFRLDTDSIAINEQCVRAQVAQMGTSQLPIWYVFSDLTCCTPGDVLTFGRVLRSDSDPFYLMPRAQTRTFDSIFGKAPVQQLELAAA